MRAAACLSPRAHAGPGLLAACGHCAHGRALWARRACGGAAHAGGHAQGGRLFLQVSPG